MTEQAKQKSGMEMSRDLYKEITAEGYKIKTEGVKSLRGEFIARAVSECGLTKNGASTYFQNLKNEAAGKSLYHKKGETQAKPFVDVSSAMANGGFGQQGNQTDVNSEVVAAKRWMVIDANGAEVESYETRKQAQEHAKSAKDLGLKVKDREKVEA